LIEDGGQDKWGRTIKELSHESLTPEAGFTTIQSF
jgi:hypothetical protein